MDRAEKMQPVAVTAGEFLVPPNVFSNFSDRIQQINRDRSGSTAAQNNFNGGEIQRFQVGGAVATSSGSGATNTRNINVSVINEFSGVNVLSGDSEEAIATIYEQGLRDKIQESIDNHEFA